jgi:uncharacterized protein (DUF2252 family)
MRWSCGIFAALLLCATVADGQDRTFDRIERAYAPYMNADDPLALPMKIRSLSADEYTFWRGSKDLFFVWCKSSCADWLADRGAYLPNHGDLHLGNIGTYAARGEWNELAFGMVDFDDSAQLPFELELLQGLITLNLVARQNNITLDAAAQQRIKTVLLQTYRTAITSLRPARRILEDDNDSILANMFTRKSAPYAQELEEYLQAGKFRAVIFSGKGKVKEILRPAMNRVDDFAAGLMQAVEHDPEMKAVFRFNSAAEIRSGIKDAVQRTRVGSSGSQGLKKYLMVLDRPLRGVANDVIFYLKQEIPSAAERQGVAAASDASPGARVKRDMDTLTEPHPYINSFCEIGNESYWVNFKEPWSSEIDPAEIKSADDLIHAARIWATVAGAMHRRDGRFQRLLSRVTPTLMTQIDQRCDAFLKQIDSDFADFSSDSRTRRHVAAIDSMIQSFGTGR